MRDVITPLVRALTDSDYRAHLALNLPVGTMDGRLVWRRRVSAEVLEFALPVDVDESEAA